MSDDWETYYLANEQGVFYERRPVQAKTRKGDRPIREWMTRAARKVLDRAIYKLPVDSTEYDEFINAAEQDIAQAFVERERKPK